MATTHPYLEALSSQIPALRLLRDLGYTYLTPAEAMQARGGKTSSVLLESILAAQLPRLNRIQNKGRTHAFSEPNIQHAIRKLTDEPYDGLVRTSENIYDLLTLGTSLTQTIDGDTRSYSLHYIDWKNPANNVYHVTDEYSVTRRRSNETRRPDIVLFVNGIPLVVIECKRPDLTKGSGTPTDEAIRQLWDYQQADEIPHLFVFSQLLLAVSTNAALYATTGTPKKFWAVWQEEADIDTEVQRRINRPLSAADKQHLYDHRDHAAEIRQHFDELEAAGERLPTVQDRTLYSLLRPARLLELAYQYIVYDAGHKKITRYQQYFAIQSTLDRVAAYNHQGQRTGGVIWHTTGSGKSLTMVMLAKALALHPTIPDPRIILVTDRVDLDDQLSKTFLACGKKVHRATSSSDLVAALRAGKFDIFTTVINKLDAAAGQGFRDDDPNTFVLVDESHRSQSNTFHTSMRNVFRNACYIGFTGTPLLKAEKATVLKFGSFIHTYPMQQAVADGAVVPLFYEGRMAELSVDKDSIDQWFERVTRHLTDDQQRDLKRKFSRKEEVSRTEQRIQQIAYDIHEHYTANYQGTGLKAQLAASSKAEALLYQRFLDEFGGITAEVVISPPDLHEGDEATDDATTPQVAAFWKRMLERFGSEEKYNTEIKAAFSRPDGVDILIVVDKLLTGFDEPRNAVLYIDKPLKEHALLQAIARVNRLHDGKEHGLIVDYRGVLGELNTALNIYNSLADFDPEDVAGMLTDVQEEIDRLPQAHANLWAVFTTVPNQRDTELLERFLEPEDRRQEFYTALTSYARSLKVALSTVAFVRDTPAAQIDRYKDDLRFFHNLRASVRQRYAETVDYKDYEQRIRALMNRHITSAEVTQMTNLVSIFDEDAFAAEVERVEGTAAKADTIANRVKKTLTEQMEQDPAAYRRFSQLIDDAIAEYRAGRLSERDYLNRMQDALAQIQQGRSSDVPAQLNRYQHARAYYGIIREAASTYRADSQAATSSDLLADAAIAIEQMIETHKIRDWTRNHDVQKAMMNALEDMLYERAAQLGLHLTGTEMDTLLEQLIEVARQRERL
jgi:type I restriction enzyme R subunit